VRYRSWVAISGGFGASCSKRRERQSSEFSLFFESMKNAAGDSPAASGP
jgi:hypothetical protein